MTEYNVFRATGMTLSQFLALRAADMTLAQMIILWAPHMIPLDDFGNPVDAFVYWYDLPLVYGGWLEDESAPSRILRFPIGETNFTDNGVSHTLEAAPFIQNDRTRVPLRVIGEALGATDLAYNVGIVTFNIGSQAFTMRLARHISISIKQRYTYS